MIKTREMILLTAKTHKVKTSDLKAWLDYYVLTKIINAWRGNEVVLFNAIVLKPAIIDIYAPIENYHDGYETDMPQELRDKTDFYASKIYDQHGNANYRTLTSAEKADMFKTMVKCAPYLGLKPKFMKKRGLSKVCKPWYSKALR